MRPTNALEIQRPLAKVPGEGRNSMSIKPKLDAVASHLVSIPSTRGATVSVVIPAYNQSRFLGAAIASVLAQTRPADEIIVVDDGSTDDPAAVVANFAGVRLVRQENCGRSAARNTGLRYCTTSYVVFLDADDRLLPGALESGLNCAAKHPDCAFVYGAHRDIMEDGEVREAYHHSPISGNPHIALLQRNLIRMLASVLFRRDPLIEVGGFDQTLQLGEDYDLYLRLAQSHSVGGHPTLVAEYRWHRGNSSNDPVAMLEATLKVLDRHAARINPNTSEQAALERGRRVWRDHYVFTMLQMAKANVVSSKAVRLLSQTIIISPGVVLRALKSYLHGNIKRAIPHRVARWVNRLRGRPEQIPFGAVRFGDLRRLSPISTNFGFDRGTPIDRYYVERFLRQYASDIHGRVLEAADNTYTTRFGGDAVTVSDILHLDASNPRATIVGDLARHDVLPEASFDCIILTDVLHYVFDMRAGVASLYRALKPGGVLLLAMPGVSALDYGDWGSAVVWSLSAAAARRLFEERFNADGMVVEAHGNVFAAMAFLQGLAMEEVAHEELDAHDPRYPIVVAVRAVKSLSR